MARMAMVVLLGLCVLPLAAAQDQPTAVDVVFVVDSSNSMSKNDPEGLRNHFMAMTADFMQGRGGDRLAIVQFAGWNETQNKKVVIFPLTEIPQPGKGADFEKAFDAAVAKAEIFGSASDINVAFELGVAEIQKQRGSTKNGLWVIVLTDAALSAPEPGNVREDYKKKAADLFKLAPDDEANLDQLNAAALDIFTKQTLPKYAGTRISAVTLAKKAPPADSPIQMLVGKESKVGVLSKDPLKDLIVPMLAGSQLYPKAKGGFYGYAKEAGTKATVPVHVYEGAVGTRALLFSRGGTLKVAVTGGDASKVESLGDGPYKVVHFRNAPPGDYTIDAEAEGGSQIESVVYSDLPYSADIKLSTPAEVAAGDEVKIDLAVTRDGKPLTDPALLKSLKAVIKIKDAKGTTTKQVEFKADSKGQFSFATDPAAPPGDIEFTVELAAVQDGTVAPYAFTPGAKTFKVSVATVVEASFDKAEVFVDEPVGFTVKGAKGTPAKELLSELGLKKGSGEHKAKLSWKDGVWSGTVPTDSIGEFQIAEEKKGGVIVKAGKNPKLTIKGRVFEATFSASEVFERQPVTITVKPADGGKAESAKDLVKEIKAGDAAIKVAYKADGWSGDVDTQKPATFDLKETTAQKYVIKPGKNSKLVVKPRGFEILDKDGKPVQKLVFPVKYIEKGQYSVDVTLKLTVGDGETGRIEALGESKDKDVVIGLAGQKTVTGAAATQTAKIVLDINTDAAIQEQQGRLVVRATIDGLSDLKWEQTIAIEVQFTDKAKKLFMKYLPFIIGGLVLLLIILYILLLARWKEQQLRAFLNNNLDTKYMLKSMGGGRSATGTEQSPASAGFNLSGMKFTENAVSLKALKADVHVFHMDKPLTAPAKLRHGDVLAVEVGSKKQYYVYFEKEPTPEELKKALDGLIESDEIFIEE